VRQEESPLALTEIELSSEYKSETKTSTLYTSLPPLSSLPQYNMSQHGSINYE